MTRPRASTVLRRFLGGDSLANLTHSLMGTSGGSWLPALRYVEHCIRRGLRGEVRIPVARRRARRRSKR
jgi:hypothetical protein